MHGDNYPHIDEYNCKYHWQCNDFNFSTHAVSSSVSNHVDLALGWLRFFACITYRFPLLALQKCKIVSQASNEKLWEHKSLQSNQSFNKWSGLSSVAMTLPLSHQVQFSNRFYNDPQWLNLMKTVFKVLLSLSNFYSELSE